MSTTEASDWRAHLVHAFETLLKTPLSAYPADATYAAYFSGNYFSECGFNINSAWVNPAALRGEKTITVGDLKLYYIDASGDDLPEPPIKFDASRSFFDLSLHGFPDEFVAKFREVCDDDESILGMDLAPLLEQHGINLSQSKPGTWEVVLARIATDGTLLDALCKATSIGDGPDSLLACGGKVNDEDEARLAAIPDPRLRDHFRLACSADGCTGLFLEKTHNGSVVAEWNECQSQRTVTVRQLEASASQMHKRRV